MLPNQQKIRQLLPLLVKRNALDTAIAAILEDRSAQTSHIAEFLAGYIFDIQLHDRPNRPGHDGIFQLEPLRGRTVDVKYASIHGESIDFSKNKQRIIPDYYLLFHGPTPDAKSKERPFTINFVFLFEALPLRQQLGLEEENLGIATPVPTALWNKAELYPRSTHPSIQLTPLQRDRIEEIKTMLNTPNSADFSVSL